MIEVITCNTKTKLSELLKKVQMGERVMFTERHVPVAMLIPAAENAFNSTEEVIQRLCAFRKGKFLKGLSLKKMIQEGRK